MSSPAHYSPQFKKDLADRQRQPVFGYVQPHQSSLALQLTTLRTDNLPVNQEEFYADFVISSNARDRVGDVVEPMGCVLDEYKSNPVVFGLHQDIPLPIGRSATPEGELTVKLHEDRITARCYFTQSLPEARQIFALVAEGMLPGCSIGFDFIDEPIPLPALHGHPYAGQRFTKWKLLEWSIVGIPCNAHAGLDRSKISPSTGRQNIIGSETADDMKPGYLPPQYRDAAKRASSLIRKTLEKGRVGDERLSPMIVKALAPLAEPRPQQVIGGFMSEAKILRAPSSDHGPTRWNKSFPEAFNGPTAEASYDEPSPFPIENVPSRPSSVSYDWICRYVGCEIKNLWRNPTFIPAPRMGSFLTGLKGILAQYHLDDTRNIHRDGKESPPQFATIELNSTKRDDFLIDGAAFYKGNEPGRGTVRFVASFEPTFGGLELTILTSNVNHSIGDTILEKAWDWARTHNFLKGEAFALSGEFLDRTKETWDDVFLPDLNRQTLQRYVELINEKGVAFANRGCILTGSPGNGKTLSGRIIRNHAKATFIWVSSRDYHHSGSFGGTSLGFEMAKELAPSVLFIEDVDNWLSDTTVDLIKTEMDGISRSSGVLTILTTNFPERLPEALIDRPGRFHDVLHFDLPTPDVRRAMLAKWLPAVSQSDRDNAVTSSDGYSGAHVYELAAFAKTLSEHDGLTPDKALQEAIEKVKAQRELIDQIQLEGSNYSSFGSLRRRKSLIPGLVVCNSQATPAIFTKQQPPAIVKAAPKKPVRAVKMTTKAMMEGGGAMGGYGIPEGEKAYHRHVMEGIRECAKLHEPNSSDGLHHFHYHPESGSVHHVHGINAKPEHLSAVKKDLDSLNGVKKVIQQPKSGPVKEQGWWEAHPIDEKEQMLQHAPATVTGPKEPADKPQTTPEPTETPMKPDGAEAGKPNEAAIEKQLVIEKQATARVFARMPARMLKEYLKVMHLKASKDPALQECVSKKIPKLIDEGYPETQSQAIAYSMCGEGKSLCAAKKKDADAGPESVGGAEEAQDIDKQLTDQPELPHGAEFGQRMLEDIETFLGLCDDEMQRTFWEDVMNEAKEMYKSRYPEIDFGGETESESGNASQSGIAEDKLAPYRKPTIDTAKNGKVPNNKSKPPRQTKRLAKRHLGVFKAATDHMGDMAAMDPGDEFTRLHKSACAMHHKDMTSSLEEIDSGGAHEEGPEVPTAGKKTEPEKKPEEKTDEPKKDADKEGKEAQRELDEKSLKSLQAETKEFRTMQETGAQELKTRLDNLLISATGRMPDGYKG